MMTANKTELRFSAAARALITRFAARRNKTQSENFSQLWMVQHVKRFCWLAGFCYLIGANADYQLAETSDQRYPKWLEVFPIEDFWTELASRQLFSIAAAAACPKPGHVLIDHTIRIFSCYWWTSHYRRSILSAPLYRTPLTAYQSEHVQILHFTFGSNFRTCLLCNHNLVHSS